MAKANANAKDEYLAAITSVWWDIDDCGAPENYDSKQVVDYITFKLARLGYHGDVSTIGYGSNIPKSVEHTEILLNHVPPEKKKLRFLENLTQWVIHNPPRRNILLISGRSDFRIKLEGLLADGGYNVFSAESVLGIEHADLDNSLAEAEAKFKAATEARYKSSKCSVWWDMSTCKLPAGRDDTKIANNIRLALFNLGYSGHITIFAYGEIPHSGPDSPIPLSTQVVLIGDCISLIHSSVNDIAEVMVADLMKWVLRNPAPANILLVASDNSCLFDSLKGTDYRVLFAQPSRPISPYPAGKTIWIFSHLLAGGHPSIIDGKQTSNDALCLELEDKYRAARTSVWWDLDNCPIPEGVNPLTVVNYIEGALFFLGYTSNVSISIYGSDMDLKKIVQQSKAKSKAKGIPNYVKLIKVTGGKNRSKKTAGKAITVDMKAWVNESSHPGPSNMLLISGDGQFYDLVTSLRVSHRANILLAAQVDAASPEVDAASAKLIGAVLTFWDWKALVEGKTNPSRQGISSYFLADIEHNQAEDSASTAAARTHADVNVAVGYYPYYTASQSGPTPSFVVPVLDNPWFGSSSTNIPHCSYAQQQPLQQLQQQPLQQQHLLHPMQRQQQQGSFPNTHTAPRSGTTVEQQLQQQGSFPNTHTAPTGPAQQQQQLQQQQNSRKN